MSSENFNPQSPDSMFATILERLKEQDRKYDEDRKDTQTFRKELAETLGKHDVRIRSLEDSRNHALGLAAGAGGLSGWISSLFK